MLINYTICLACKSIAFNCNSDIIWPIENIAVYKLLASQFYHSLFITPYYTSTVHSVDLILNHIKAKYRGTCWQLEWHRRVKTILKNRIAPPYRNLHRSEFWHFKARLWLRFSPMVNEFNLETHSNDFITLVRWSLKRFFDSSVNHFWHVTTTTMTCTR